MTGDPARRIDLYGPEASFAHGRRVYTYDSNGYHRVRRGETKCCWIGNPPRSVSEKRSQDRREYDRRAHDRRQHDRRQHDSHRTHGHHESHHKLRRLAKLVLDPPDHSAHSTRPRNAPSRSKQAEQYSTDRIRPKLHQLRTLETDSLSAQMRKVMLENE
jgi:hypothetical protein